MPKSSVQAPSNPNLFNQARPGSNLPEFSVGEISQLLKKTVEENFGQVRIRGEISECKAHSNGHIYITLKDEAAVLAAVCWRGQAGRLGLKPETGMEVICTGSLTTYMGQSKYQLVIEQMALAGVGALLKLLDERKKKLAAEGLFNEARKQLLPFLPEVIGVITSPSGAVIRDIIHRLTDRFPRRVLLWPVAVQGDGAAQQVADAIEGFNALPENGAVPRPDVLIIARGGGSVEDLMPFNEEVVVRAAANSNIPLISAVGHETDTTLIDFAADKRAPTPTAAAEMAVPVRSELLAQVTDDGRRIWECARRMIAERRERLDLMTRALGDPLRAIEPLLQRLDDKAGRLVSCWQAYYDRRVGRLVAAAGKLRHPRDLLDLARQGLLHAAHQLEAGWREYFLRREHQLAALGPALDYLAPKNVLKRGYALVQNAKGHLVTKRTEAKPGEKVRIEFQDGPRGAVIED